MPGLFGITDHGSPEDLRAAFDRLVPPGAGPWSTESLVDPAGRWAIGRTHLGVLQPQPQLCEGAPVQVLFHGDLHNAHELEALLASSAPATANRPAWLIAALYDRFGTGFAARLDGVFCCAIVDRPQHRVVLVNDLLGSYPMYWTTTSDGDLVFGSELRAILKQLSRAPALNPAALADYLTFGFPLGVKTLAEGINLVPPAATLVFDWDTGSATVNRYGSAVDWFEPWSGTRADYVTSVQEAFTHAVGRATAGTHRFGLALSGGLDSRAILSAVNGASASLSTCTLGVKGCADEAIAEKLAAILGTRHRFFELDDRYLQSFLPNLRRMVSLTDGMYLSHGLTESLALGFLSSTDITVLLRGHGGELAKTRLAWPLQTDDRIDSFTRTDELVPYLLNRANYISRDLDWRDLFTEPWVDRMRDAPRASLEESLGPVPLGPADLCSYLYLQEHHRRFTVASLELFRQAVEVRLPFVDRAFLNVLFRGRASWREDTSLHRAMIAAGRPELLRIRDANTGAALDAGPLEERLLDKVNSLFRRLNVPGYRHYHDFQRWMRDQLMTSVEDVLLHRSCLDRGMLRETGLHRLVDETRQGRKDHSYLLQILLIVELWQQEHA